MKIRVDKAVITDANILIDYMEAGKKVLQLFAASIEGLYVPLSVLKEVPKLKESEALKLGIKIIDTETTLLFEATSINTGCSFNDNVCFLTAKQEGIICATNDKRLRRVCGDHGVNVLWGLQFMFFLVQEGKLLKKEAVEIARNIAQVNSTITIELVDEFERIMETLHLSK